MNDLYICPVEDHTECLEDCPHMVPHKQYDLCLHGDCYGTIEDCTCIQIQTEFISRYERDNSL
jgi:hypothetical protein